jgi:hypothetical protein
LRASCVSTWLFWSGKSLNWSRPNPVAVIRWPAFRPQQAVALRSRP